jgi:sterol desaturase/sphingolipid hydroxylase (fatty acid hydroxylase superfamily)
MFHALLRRSGKESDMDTITPLVGPVIIGFFAVGLVLERVVPARPLARSRGWYLRGGLSFVSTMTINALLPALFAEAVSDIAPLKLASLGLWASAAIAFLATDFASYLLHRLQHRVPAIWRWTHQAHHSAERMDVVGAAYFHPFDVGLQTVLSTCVPGLLGVSPDAAALVGMAGVALAVFQHLNVRTPRWLGYMVQRPESHSVHHERGVHAYNYGNLSFWDQFYGTFRNPNDFSQQAGFYDGASARVGAMLLGRDVARAPRSQLEHPAQTAA